MIFLRFLCMSCLYMDERQPACDEIALLLFMLSCVVQPGVYANVLNFTYVTALRSIFPTASDSAL